MAPCDKSGLIIVSGKNGSAEVVCRRDLECGLFFESYKIGNELPIETLWRIIASTLIPATSIKVVYHFLRHDVRHVKSYPINQENTFHVFVLWLSKSMTEELIGSIPRDAVYKIALSDPELEKRLQDENVRDAILRRFALTLRPPLED